jgi:hypothetical protein
VTERGLRRSLDSFRPAGEEQAGERTWTVVGAAYREAFAEGAPRRSRPLPLRAAVVLALVGAIAAAALSSPGRAVLDSVREAIGVEHAARALFSLPAEGSLVVASPQAGAWIVHADGSKRRLGDYGEASWSPFGRFVVASRRDELAALEPDGAVRWSLARRDVRFPRWGGSRTDTRIAYLAGPRLRVVAGDGTGDADTGLPAAAPVAPAWQPAAAGKPFLLAYADTRGRIYTYESDRGRVRFRTGPQPVPSKLEWSSDGRLLLAVSPRTLRVYDANGRLVSRDEASDASRDVDATFLPGSGEVAVVRAHGAQTDVFLLRSGRLLFRATGRLTQAVASPDGRRLLLAWPTADQWVFVPTGGVRRIRASANVATQFGGFPSVAGWCCATQ